MSDERHEQRLNMMKLRILKAESDNLKSQRADREMVDDICKIIIDEERKIHGGTRHAD